MSLLNNISTYLLSKKESRLDVIKIAHQFVSWNQLSKVLIIACDNQLSDIVDFINTCQKDKISVHVAVICNGKQEQVPKPHFEHTIFDKKQFSFFEVPTDKALQKLNTTFDVLINMGTIEQIKSLALSKLLAAKCKIANFENPAFDITINTNKTMNSSEYLKQVIVYLNMIKPTKNS
ncbi:MAG: hypothetical protein H7141_06865 [Burkholderiales bacterium]|nr:hypothetical protein [Bacteroidia bacterium]